MGNNTFKITKVIFITFKANLLATFEKISSMMHKSQLRSEYLVNSRLNISKGANLIITGKILIMKT